MRKACAFRGSGPQLQQLSCLIFCEGLISHSQSRRTVGSTSCWKISYGTPISKVIALKSYCEISSGSIGISSLDASFPASYGRVFSAETSCRRKHVLSSPALCAFGRQRHNVAHCDFKSLLLPARSPSAFCSSLSNFGPNASHRSFRSRIQLTKGGAENIFSNPQTASLVVKEGEEEAADICQQVDAESIEPNWINLHDWLALLSSGSLGKDDFEGQENIADVGNRVKSFRESETAALKFLEEIRLVLPQRHETTVRKVTHESYGDWIERPGGWPLRGEKLTTSFTISPAVYRGSSSLRSYSSESTSQTHDTTTTVQPEVQDYSQRAVVTAIWCNFLVLTLKVGVWIMTSSNVMMAEAIHSLADLANQGLLAYGLMSSRRAPDAMHPYGYSKERFVWSLISAVGIFCLGSGATIVHGLQNLWTAEPLQNVYLAALVIAGSMVMEGASLLVAINSVKKGAAGEGMTVHDYMWKGHDPTSVAVMMEDGAAVAGLFIAGMTLAMASWTGNPIWDPIGSIIVGNLLGVVAIFLIQRNRHALLGRSMDTQDMLQIINILNQDPVVDAIYDCKSEVIGPGAYRFKAEIDFNGVVIVQNYLQRVGRETWHKEFKEAVNNPQDGALDRVLAIYGEEVVTALGSEVDRLEREIQRIVPGVRHVDIEAHNPKGPVPKEKFYLY